MKVFIVTSEVTFVPNNYNYFLENLFRELSLEENLDLSLIVLQNNSCRFLLKVIYLFFSGARFTAYHLLKNSFNAFFKDRKYLTKTYGIPIHYFKSPNSPGFYQFVKKHQVDIIVNARTRFIYNNKILKLPKLGALNIHHGLLPHYKGLMCDLWALFEERAIGFSIHVMEKRIDSGAILETFETSLPGQTSPSKNFLKIIEESSKLEGIKTAHLIKSIQKNKAIPKGRENASPHQEHSKNPDFFMIRKMLQKGITL